MTIEIPFDSWSPLSVNQLLAVLADAPFDWCLAGGYAIEQFLGAPIRSHSDIDIIIFRDEQLSLQSWLKNWQLYAADPPGTLRTWHEGEFLPVGIHDIWGHQIGATAWQLQIMLTEVEGTQWFSRRNPLIRGKRKDMLTVYNGIPCIRPEIQLLYKAKNQRPKDNQDFYACLPHLDMGAKVWLKDCLMILYPDGHDWLIPLTSTAHTGGA